MMVDAILRFQLEGHFKGNQGKTMFPFDIHIKQNETLKRTKHD